MVKYYWMYAALGIDDYIDSEEVVAWSEIPTFTERNENCFDIKQ